jgi:phytoene dehydrogenase-like protein
LLFFNGLREVDLRERGFGHHIPALLASKGKAQMCRGGSAQLAQALVNAVDEAGGQIILETEPAEILVEGERVVGVETKGGMRLTARHFVASALNPQQTFLDLIAPEALPQAWRDKAAAFRYNLLAPLFGLYLELDEAPSYKATAAHPHLNQAFMVILGLESPADFDEIVHHHEAGSMPPTITWGSTPTLFDPSQAPDGKHTAFMWEKLPYALGGDPAQWDQVKEEHGRQILSAWMEHAPNIQDALLYSFVRSPLDVERTLPNMRGGDLLVGAFSGDQVGDHRPFPGAGHYRGHLPGLYLCGSCCHPGGNITGLPGYNCAQVLFADLGIAADWAPEPLDRRM